MVRKRLALPFLFSFGLFGVTVSCGGRSALDEDDDTASEPAGGSTSGGSGGTATGGALPGSGGIQATTGGAFATGGVFQTGGGSTGGAAAGGASMGGESMGGAFSDRECLEQELAPGIAAALDDTQGEGGEANPRLLTQVSILSGGIQGIECLKNLEAVTLVVEQGQQPELALLAELRHLARLNVTGALDTGFLAELGQLEELTLNGGTEMDLTPVGEMKRLRKLVLTELDFKSPTPLEQLAHLEEFVLYDANPEFEMWDSSFMDDWALRKLVLISAGVRLDCATLDTSKLEEFRIFGPTLTGTELLGAPADGMGELYASRGYFEEDPALSALCQRGWQIWAQPTWCSINRTDLCASMSDE